MSQYGDGGALTLTWYTYMCLPFGALFHEIWYSDWGGFSSKMKEPIAKLHKSVYFGQIIVKNTQFGLSFQNGWEEIGQNIGIEKVRLSRSSRHIDVRFW